MTLEKTVTLKMNDEVQTHVDVENIIDGDELFLRKSEENLFEIFSPEGFSIVTFNGEDELRDYIGFTFNEFEDYYFEVTKKAMLHANDDKFTLTIKFQVHQLAC